MFQLVILSLFLNLPITPMPSESVVLDGVRGNRPIVAPGKVNWWSDSAHPGENSNVVLYGHSPGVFIDLHTLKPGAIITVTRKGRDFDYVVTWVFVVKSSVGKVEAGRWIDPTPAERLTMVTCSGDDRLIVLAEMR
jgi:sortase (surface protein transpeptidase)